MSLIFDFVDIHLEWVGFYDQKYNILVKLKWQLFILKSFNFPRYEETQVYIYKHIQIGHNRNKIEC